MLRGRLGTAGSLACLLSVLLLAALLRGWRAGIALALAAVLAALFHPVALGVARSRMSWAFTGLLLLSGALWLGPADRQVGLLGLSSRGLAVGAWMALRALAVLVALRGFAASASPGELAGLLERVGHRGLGFTFGVAVNLLPSLERSMSRTWDAIRMRGGLRRRWRLMLRLGAVTVVSNALRRADNIVIAAETRGPGLRRTRPLPLRRGTLDWAVVSALAVLVAALVVRR